MLRGQLPEVHLPNFYRRDKALGRGCPRWTPRLHGPYHPLMQQLLMIEDRRRLAQMVGEYLERSGFAVAPRSTPGPAWPCCRTAGRHADRVLISWTDACGHGRGGLPARPRDVRRSRKVPVLMLTAKGDPMDRIVASSWAPTTTCPSRSSRASCCTDPRHPAPRRRRRRAGRQACCASARRDRRDAAP